jgi:putative transposase
VVRIGQVWNVPRATFYDWRARRQPTDLPPERPKPGPRPGIADEALVDAIRTVLADAESLGIRGEGHRKVWARLRHRGVRTSKKRTLRLMRSNGLLAPTRVGRPRGPRTHDGTIHTDRPNEMWGTDATQVALRSGRLAWVFLAVDHCTAELVGVHASLYGNRREAFEPIRQGVTALIGPIGEGIAKGLAVRHDHGSQYMSRDFQAELTFLGARSSPSFVAQPEGNGVAERFVRTLKEQLLWVETFDTVEALCEALQRFRARYNASWLVARHGHRTPERVRADLLAGPSKEAA